MPIRLCYICEFACTLYVTVCVSVNCNTYFTYFALRSLVRRHEACPTQWTCFMCLAPEKCYMEMSMCYYGVLCPTNSNIYGKILVYNEKH